MSTVGKGYMATYLQSRRELLDLGVKQATATIANDRRKYEAERVYLQGMVSGLDTQILEYDKLLAKAVSDREKLARPRTTRATYGSSRESVALATLAQGSKTLTGMDHDARVGARATVEVPVPFAADIAETVAAMKQQKQPLALAQAQAADFTTRMLSSDAFASLPPGARAATIGHLEGQFRLVGSLADSYAIDPAPYLSKEEMPFLDQSVRDKAEAQAYARLRGPEAREGADIGLAAIRDRGAFLGGGSSSVTKEELAPGEAARMARVNSEGFKATAKAMRDDGRLDDDERKKLEEAGIDPDDYLDEALMQAVARTGLLTAERAALVGRRSAGRADLDALVAPDESDQRRRELTGEVYGAAGTTPTEALFMPRKVREKDAAERQRLSAKQAMLQGVMRAAGDSSPDLSEDENVYAAQLTKAVQSGNTAAIKETYGLMREAGYDDERLVSGFAVASRRARQLDARREAQQVNAATE